MLMPNGKLHDYPKMIVSAERETSRMVVMASVGTIRHPDSNLCSVCRCILFPSNFRASSKLMAYEKGTSRSSSILPIENTMNRSLITLVFLN